MHLKSTLKITFIGNQASGKDSHVRLVPLTSQVDDLNYQPQVELLDHESLEALIKSVDEHEVLEEGVGKVMLKIVEDLTEKLVRDAISLNKHRGGSGGGGRKLEPKDLQFLLSQQMNMAVPPLLDGRNSLAHNDSRYGGPMAKRVALPAHQHRLNAIEQFNRKM